MMGSAMKPAEDFSRNVAPQSASRKESEALEVVSSNRAVSREYVENAMATAK